MRATKNSKREKSKRKLDVPNFEATGEICLFSHLWLNVSAFAGIGDKKGRMTSISSPNRATRGLRKLYKLAGARRVFRRAPLDDQPACKPGSVWSAVRTANVTTIPLVRRLPGASSNLPERQIRTRSGIISRAVPIWSCSRWGLPCRFRCRNAVRSYRTVSPLPRLILNAPRRSVLCGTIRGVLSPAGRYLAPCPWSPDFPLPPPFGIGMERPSGRLTRIGMGARGRCVKSRRATALKRP